MEALSRAYNGLRGFVDEFANSTTGSNSAPRKMENRKAWYAEWDDNYMGDLLNNYLTKSILRKIADSYYGQQLDVLLEEATELTVDNYPMLYDVYNHCCVSLGMFTQPKAYITGKMKGINALSLEVKGNKLILISPKAATCLPPEEQAFLLGHEISHHQQGNLVCHTVNGLIDNINNASEIFGPLVLDTIEVPLKRWCRCSEFNADRAGYICCKNEEAIKQLFLRLGMKSNSSAYADYKEVGAAHPMLHTRWNVLREYIQQK
jgi:Zn-dependent protease with chaperone function